MIDFVTGTRDLTRQWRRGENLSLTLALDLARLNTAQLGGPVDAASFLGPAEDRAPAEQGYFCYHSLGVAVDCDEQQMIGCLEIVYQDEFGKFQPFAGRVTFAEKEVDLAGMTEPQFLARFGECYWRDRDEEESILFYEFPGREWQIEFGQNGALKRVLVSGTPLMSNPRQRAAYQVTKAWPPA